MVGNFRRCLVGRYVVSKAINQRLKHSTNTSCVNAGVCWLCVLRFDLDERFGSMSGMADGSRCPFISVRQVAADYVGLAGASELSDLIHSTN